MPSPDVEATRERILESAYARIADAGIAQVTVEAVAQEAGLSRATIYRHFPGGRDELLEALVSWEVARFFTMLGEETAKATGFTEWLTLGLAAARRQMEEHALLQRLLEDEADQLVPRLVTVMPIVQAVLREQLINRLAEERLQKGVDRGEAADFLARLMISYFGTPGTWQLDDPAQLDKLVRTQLLAGILADH
jgi:AcrR family transcriptional regulator